MKKQVPIYSDLVIRHVQESDFPALAEAHQASIQEIGAAYYSHEQLEIWGRRKPAEGYRKATENGEYYFVAERSSRPGYVLGFSSYYYKDDRHHLMSLYVRGTEARRGLGQKLLKAVEMLALEQGAQELHLASSLAGETFYKISGFVEHGRRKIVMADEVSGRSTQVECIDMTKPLHVPFPVPG